MRAVSFAERLSAIALVNDTSILYLRYRRQDVDVTQDREAVLFLDDADFNLLVHDGELTLECSTQEEALRCAQQVSSHLYPKSSITSVIALDRKGRLIGVGV